MAYTCLPDIKSRAFDIIALDTEQDEDANPYVWCVAGYKVINNETHLIQRTFDNPEACAKYLFGKHQKWHHTILTGMNLKFDLNTLFRKGYFEWEILEKMGSFITVLPPSDYKGNGNTIKVIELSNFFPGKSLVQIIKDKNGNFTDKYLDFLEITRTDHHIDKHILGKDGDIKEMERACMSHAWAAVFGLRDIQKQIRGLDTQIELTPALTAQKLHCRKYLPKECQILAEHSNHITDEVKFFMFKSYYGGRTENMVRARKKNIIEHVSGIDINSSYPNVMRNRDYPDIITYREVHIEKPESLIKYMNEYEGLAWVGIKAPKNKKIMLLPTIYQGRLCFPKGEWSGVYTFPEIRKALEEGYKIKYVDRVGICKKTKQPLFKDYVDALYHLKLDEGSEYKAIAKLMLNSLYGKFGQKKNEKTGWQVVKETEIPENLHIDAGEIIETPNEKIDEKKDNYKWMIYNDLIMKYIPETPTEQRGFAKKAYPLIAAYVTSYARMYLYDAMQAIGEEYIYYCDTDSIYCDTHALNQAIETGKIEIDPNKLGAWDLEHDNEEMEIRGLKYYRLRKSNYSFINLNGGEYDYQIDIDEGWKHTIKGVPKKHHKTFWKNKFVEFKRPVKLSSAIRFKKIVNKFVSVIKSDANPNAKRYFPEGKDNDSSPIELTDSI